MRTAALREKKLRQGGQKRGRLRTHADDEQAVVTEAGTQAAAPVLGKLDWATGRPGFGLNIDCRCIGDTNI